MDPFTLAILALIAAGGGYAWYKFWGPGSHKAPSRSITLDASMPDADKQAVIAAIMGEKDPNRLDILAAQYGAYPWGAFELHYRAWELRGSQGAPPSPPQVSAPQGQPTPSGGGPQPAPNLAQQAVQAAQNALSGQPSGPPGGGGPVPPGPGPGPAPQGLPPGVPQPPFNLTYPGTGAYKSNPTYITAYQGALTYLAWKLSKPTFDPGGVDGRYGTNTKNAVAAFQKWAGLSVDGNAGKDTAAALDNAIKASTSQVVSGVGNHIIGETEVGRAASGGETEVEVGALSGAPFLDIAPHVVDETMEVGAVAAAAMAPSATRRAKGGWYILVRPEDRVWPRSIAEIGSGVRRGTPGSIRHLVDINQHLAPGGVIRQFVPGDEINVPNTWVMPLKQKGFELHNDAHENDPRISV